jgi:transposase-like protein
MHERRSVEAVLELHRRGVSVAAIARQLGIPRSTVRDWVRGSLGGSRDHLRVP